MKTKKVIFTICAQNYYGLAQVLKKSVLKHHDDVDFLVFIADGIPKTAIENFDSDAIDGSAVMHKYLPEGKFFEIAFKYNLTEYCTAIKPFCFKHIFETTDYTEVVYLDPDIFVFSSMAPIFDKLENTSIVLTPHILFPSSLEGKRKDRGIMATGIYNLGFIGIHRSKVGITYINWWGDRLLDQCFIESHDGLFTDQKWADFIPALFPIEEFLVFRHVGANLAPWNFHERLVSTDAVGYSTVRRRVDPLEKLCIENSLETEAVIFVHFSGFDYKRLCSGEIAQNNIEGLRLYPDLQPLIDEYMMAVQLMKETVLKFLEIKYSYATFQDNKRIASFHRRLYRSAIESGLTYGNPFSIGSKSFHGKLIKCRLLPSNPKVYLLDKSNKNNIGDIQPKLAKLNLIMRGLLRIIGLSNYILFLRLMRPYSRAESQLHLIDTSKNKL